MVGQGPAVLAAGAGRVGCFFFVFFFSSRLSYLPFLMLYLLGDGWNTEILWSRPLLRKGSCQLLPEACSVSTG